MRNPFINFQKKDMNILKFQNFQEFENFLDILISVSFFKGLVYSDDFFKISELKKELEENKVRDITIQKCLNKLIKKHYKEILNVSTQKFQMFQIKNRKKNEKVRK